MKINPQKTLIATSTEDCCLMIWSIKTSTRVYDIKFKSKPHYCLQWSPTGPGTANPDAKKWLVRYIVKE